MDIEPSDPRRWKPVKKRRLATTWVAQAGSTPKGHAFIELRLERERGDTLAAIYLSPACADQLREALRTGRNAAGAHQRLRALVDQESTSSLVDQESTS